MSALRDAVVRLAAAQAGAGHHYLKCGVGQQFDADGHSLGGEISGRANSVQFFSRGGSPTWMPRELRFVAWSILLGKKICAGRCNVITQNQTLAGNPDDYPPLSPGSPAPPAASNPAGKLWWRPRDDPDGQRMLCECCIGKRHFDCIGFVNWCFWTVVHAPDITGTTMITEWKNLWTTPIAPNQIEAGDILFADNDRHIGIAVSPTHVVHAAGHHLGVMVDSLGSSPGHSWRDGRVARCCTRNRRSTPLRHAWPAAG